jgi:predicted permease
MISVDCRHALRSLQARPWSSLTLIAILSVGVGLNSAMFALADPYLLRPLPYGNPERLVALTVVPRPGRLFRTSETLPTLQEWRRRTDLFESIAAYADSQRFEVASPVGHLMLNVVPVSANIFDVLKVAVPPIEGWTDQVSTEHVLAVLHGSGIRRLTEAERPATRLNTDVGTVWLAASLPKTFIFPSAEDLHRVDALTPAQFNSVVVGNDRSASTVNAIARLRAGVTLQAVQAAVTTPPSSAVDVKAESLQAIMKAGHRALALGAMVAAFLVAALCASNAVNLVVARGTFRADEFAIRSALGASRLQVLRLISLELGALTAISIIAGLAVAGYALAAVVTVMPSAYAALGRPELTPRVMIFAAILGMTVFAAMLGPAWSVSSRPPSMARGRGGSDSRGLRRSRLLMIAIQTSSGMILVAAGFLLARSQIALWWQDSGLSRPEEVRTLTVQIPERSAQARRGEEVRETVAALRHARGVQVTGAFSGWFLNNVRSIGGVRIFVNSRHLLVIPREVTASYFNALGTVVRSGRVLLDSDRGWDAVVINEAFAKLVWPDRDPARATGETIAIETGRQVGVIVGVIKDTHDRALDVPATAALFKPFGPTLLSPFVTYAIRLDRPTADVDHEMERIVTSVAPDVIVVQGGGLIDRLSGTVTDRTFATIMLGIFACASLLITATGLSGVVAFVAARRTRELAVRLAMGAQRWQLVTLVVRESVFAALVGSGFGTLIALWLSRVLEHLLYRVKAGDLASFVAAATTMLMVAGVAALLPAVRACALSPTIALRRE